MIWIWVHTRVLDAALWLTIGSVAVLGVACDSQGSKQDSLYRKLEGTWTIQEIRVDKTAINFRDRTVTFMFDQDGKDRTYVLRRVVSGDTTAVRGQIDLVDRQQLAMVTGFEGPILWRYTFEKPSGFDSTVQFALSSARDRGVRSFLTAVGVHGGARTVQIDFVRD